MSDERYRQLIRLQETIIHAPTWIMTFNVMTEIFAPLTVPA